MVLNQPAKLVHPAPSQPLVLTSQPSLTPAPSQAVHFKFKHTNRRQEHHY
jgi:hypothetical protein